MEDEKEECLMIGRGAGFTDVSVVAEKQVVIPETILLDYLPAQELDQMKKSGTGIRSIAVTAKKPEKSTA